MRAPGFWARPPGLAAALLAPLSAIWTAATRRRLRRPGHRAPVPVICVGNLTAGGTGKTPTAMALATMLQGMGITPHILSRGYGGRLEGPIQVDPVAHNAADVGDEPLLLAAFAPTWISADRAAGAEAAARAGADVILMDDGFQNPGLAKDLPILVIDADAGFGNGRVIPAGPLREPIADGMARADAVILVGAPPARGRFLRENSLTLPVFEASLAALRTGIDLAGQKVVAFAGIGRPEKFFATLDDQGAVTVARHGFADHEPYSEAMLTRLLRQAHGAGAELVTTEKDAIRLPDRFRREVLTLPVRLQFADEHRMIAFLGRVI